MVGCGRPPRNARRTADRGSDVEQRDPHDIEIERLQQRIRDLEIQREIHDDKTLSNPSDWYDEENPFGARRQNLRGTNRDDPLRNFGMKIEIPEFGGKAHPDEFIDWLRKKNNDEVWCEVIPMDACHILLGRPWQYDPNSTKPSSSQQADVGIGTIANPTNSRVLRCFKYQGLRHVARECPNKLLVTIMDDTTPVYDIENDEDVVQDIDGLVYADQGEALVTQRVLNVAVAETGDDTSWLRNNIFHTKCMTKGK
nr:reverse transcriptase domain-containing protein [Tanacetum cinerariifolium]